MTSSVITLTNGEGGSEAHSPTLPPPAPVAKSGPAEKLSVGESRDLLLTALALLAALPKEILAVLWRNAGLAQLNDTLRLLKSNIEYSISKRINGDVAGWHVRLSGITGARSRSRKRAAGTLDAPNRFDPNSDP